MGPSSKLTFVMSGVKQLGEGPVPDVLEETKSGTQIQHLLEAEGMYKNMGRPSRLHPVGGSGRLYWDS